ncbi:hypothetical protein C8R44DRAFT_602437 [Mycena epipterygia]|nr:hypothetical protein C8R44DRAFT_602437 [Mycena epipterygia]
MRECNTPNVPSFSALRKKQAQLTKQVNITPRVHTSAQGNKFYMNHPIDLLSLDWANPCVRKLMQVYPEVTTNISQLYHGSKWVEELELDDLTPMWADWKFAAHRHFYIKELSQLVNGQYVIPLKWVIFENTEPAEFYRVSHYPEVRNWTGIFRYLTQFSQSNIFVIQTHEVMRIPATDLRFNVLDLLAQGIKLNFTEGSPKWSETHCNPIRDIAKGKPVFNLRIMPWSDDVSGNVSKQYNPHMNIYIVNANIPHKKLSQEYFIRFCSTSPNASSGEQFDGMSEDFKPGEYYPAYDCLLEQDILFRIDPHSLPADNPAQAETSSGSGAKANYWCRYDKSGGTAAERETDEGYHAQFEPGIPRTPEETVQTIKDQIFTACLGVQDAVDAIHTRTGVKDKTAVFWIDQLIDKARKVQHERISDPRTRDARFNDTNLTTPAKAEIKAEVKKQIQTELFDWVIMQPPERYAKLPTVLLSTATDLRPGDHFNVLLRLRGLDPHKDSPFEILHTYLLGVDKYVWHDTSNPKAWDDKKCELFATRLQSSSIDGLTLPPIRARYLVKYRNSLIGKHFKALQQLTVFHLDDTLCSALVLELWKAIGELGAMLWYPEIKNMAQYQADIKILIANVLDIWALIDPNRINVKLKLHVLPHAVDDIRRFGPAILYATEGFECWNAIFRLSSILSNHLAPSHDIAVTLADMERFKHQVSGGWWKDDSGNFIQAAPKIRSFLTTNKELQRRLGWAQEIILQPGAIKLCSSKKRDPLRWKEALGRCWKPEMFNPAGIIMWNRGKQVISQSQDICRDGSWVFFKNSEGAVLPGRIFKIIVPATTAGSSVIILEQFTLRSEMDKRLNMPVLSNMNHAILVEPEALVFKFNCQHDCRQHKCKFVESTETIAQGRIITSATQLPLIMHTVDDDYFLNMHAMHNAHLIRETLPRELTKPQPYLSDRLSKHNELAAQLRVSGPAKRADTNAKRAATMKKNKAARANQNQRLTENGPHGHGSDESGGE